MKEDTTPSPSCTEDSTPSPSCKEDDRVAPVQVFGGPGHPGVPGTPVGAVHSGGGALTPIVIEDPVPVSTCTEDGAGSPSHIEDVAGYNKVWDTFWSDDIARKYEPTSSSLESVETRAMVKHGNWLSGYITLRGAAVQVVVTANGSTYSSPEVTNVGDADEKYFRVQVSSMADDTYCKVTVKGKTVTSDYDTQLSSVMLRMGN